MLFNYCFFVAASLNLTINRAREMLHAEILTALAEVVIRLETAKLHTSDGVDDPLTRAGAALYAVLKTSNDLFILILQYRAFDTKSRINAWIQTNADISCVRLLGVPTTPSLIIEGLACAASNLMISGPEYQRRLRDAGLIDALSTALSRPLGERARIELAHCLLQALWPTEKCASTATLELLRSALPILTRIISDERTSMNEKLCCLKAISLNCSFFIEPNIRARTLFDKKESTRFCINQQSRVNEMCQQSDENAFKELLRRYFELFITTERIGAVLTCCTTGKKPLVLRAIEVLHILLIGFGSYFDTKEDMQRLRTVCGCIGTPMKLISLLLNESQYSPTLLLPHLSFYLRSCGQILSLI